MYLIIGDEFNVLIDTGVNTANILDFLLSGEISDESIKNLPYLVVNTHNHFDHIGGNYIFSPKGGPKHEKCVDLCAGDGDKEYTLNFPETTLSAAVGAHSHAFEVTRWLENGEVIKLKSGEDTSEILKVSS